MHEAGKSNILIVENDEDTRRIYTDILGCIGGSVFEAANPYEAFEYLRRQRMSLILTDLHMPGGGIDYLAMLRREDRICPIVAITGLGSEVIRQAAMLAGATVFLEKPIRTRELRDIVNRYLHRIPVEVLPLPAVNKD